MRNDLYTRLDDLIEHVPDWLWPVFNGPAILLVAILARGGILLVPILILYFAFVSTNRLGDLWVGTQIVALLFGAAALGGLLHGVLGRRLLRLATVGPYLAGALALAPYMGALGCLLQLREAGKLFAPWNTATYAACTVCWLIFGPALGHTLFRD